MIMTMRMTTADDKGDMTWWQWQDQQENFRILMMTRADDENDMTWWQWQDQHETSGFWWWQWHDDSDKLSMKTSGFWWWLGTVTKMTWHDDCDKLSMKTSGFWWWQERERKPSSSALWWVSISMKITLRIVKGILFGLLRVLPIFKENVNLQQNSADH